MCLNVSYSSALCVKPDQFRAVFLQKQEEMKKQSKIAFQRQKNIKNLLEQLKTIDLQSTELKINNLIQRQRTNYREARELNTSYNTQRINNRQATQEVKTHSKTYKEKENEPQSRPSQGPPPVGIGLPSPGANNKHLIANYRSKRGISTERYSAQPQRLKLSKADLPTLPILSCKTSKRNSLQTSQGQLPPKADPFSALNRTDSECIDLQVIEQQLFDPSQKTLLGFTKLQKQRSWAYSGAIQ